MPLPAPVTSATLPSRSFANRLTSLLNSSQRYGSGAMVRMTELIALLSTSCQEVAMGELNEKKRDKLPKQEFAFPKERKEPLNDASHVRNAVARFDQVKGVSDEERDEAWKRIKSAAKEHGVELQEKSWRELGKAD